MDFLDKYKMLCKGKGISKSSAANQIGFNKSTVTKWERQKEKGIDPTPTSDILKKIADYFGVSVDYLLTGEQKEKPSHELGEPIGNLIGIPIIASVKAGYNGIAMEDDTGETVNVPEFMLHGNCADECRAMHVRGDSMYPKMQDGDVVIVHLQSEVENGAVAICIVNGDEGTIKRFFRYPDRVELWPDNPNVPKMILRRERLESFHLYGKAIGLIRENL